MERLKSPPREESPEEAGARIIRDLLAMPDPPQTLEEDLLETNMRFVQNEEIIPLQLALERQKLALRASIATQLEEHFRACPSLTKEQPQRSGPRIRKKADRRATETHEKAHR